MMPSTLAASSRAKSPSSTSQVIQALLDIKAVGFRLESPITFKTGLLSPVYIDNRVFPSHPDQWRVVIAGFQQLIHDHNLKFEVVAGIETAGIPHSSVLGYILAKPSVFIRKKVKDHGAKKMIEGGQVAGQRVLLIEDHVTTASSSLHGVEALRAAGAIVSDCLAITTYGFAQSATAFGQAQIKLHTLAPFEQILQQAHQQQLIDQHQLEVIEAWWRDPWAWTAQRGGPSEPL